MGSNAEPREPPSKLIKIGIMIFIAKRTLYPFLHIYKIFFAKIVE